MKTCWRPKASARLLRCAIVASVFLATIGYETHGEQLAPGGTPNSGSTQAATVDALIRKIRREDLIDLAYYGEKSRSNQPMVTEIHAVADLLDGDYFGGDALLDAFEQAVARVREQGSGTKNQGLRAIQLARVELSRSGRVDCAEPRAQAAALKNQTDYTGNLTRTALIREMDINLDDTNPMSRRESRSAEERAKQRVNNFVHIAMKYNDADTSRLLTYPLLNSDGSQPAGAIAKRLKSPIGQTKPDPWLCEMVEAAAEIEAAWAARGHEFAADTPPGALRAFDDHLAKAGDWLLKARQRNPERPESLAGLVKLAAWGHEPQGRTAKQWFLDTMAIDPTNPIAHDGMLTAVSDRWGGEYRSQVRFAEYCARQEPFDPRTAMLAYVVARVRDDDSVTVFPNRDLYDIVKQMLDRCLAMPRCPFSRNDLLTRLLVVAYHAKDAETIKRVRETAGFEADQSVLGRWRTRLPIDAVIPRERFSTRVSELIEQAAQSLSQREASAAIRLLDDANAELPPETRGASRRINQLRFIAERTLILSTGNPLPVPLDPTLAGWRLGDLKDAEFSNNGLNVVCGRRIFRPSDGVYQDRASATLVLDDDIGVRLELEFDVEFPPRSTRDQQRFEVSVFWGMNDLLEEDDTRLTHATGTERIAGLHWAIPSPPSRKNKLPNDFTPIEKAHIRLVVWDTDFATYADGIALGIANRSKNQKPESLQETIGPREKNRLLMLRITNATTQPVRVSNVTVRKLLRRPDVLDAVLPPTR